MLHLFAHSSNFVCPIRTQYFFCNDEFYMFNCLDTTTSPERLWYLALLHDGHVVPILPIDLLNHFLEKIFLPNRAFTILTRTACGLSQHQTVILEALLLQYGTRKGLWAWASEVGAGEALAPTWILKILSKEGYFLGIEWENINVTTFGSP